MILPRPGPPSGRAKVATFLVLIGLMLCVGYYYGLDYALLSFTHESTDDAFLESHIVTVAPRVAGQVAAVHVKENQRVRQSEPLLELDPRDFEVQLAQKKAASGSADANLASAAAGLELVKARYETAQATERQEQANAEAARAKAERAEADFKRAQELRQTGVMSPEEFDRARAEAASTSADQRAAEQKAAAAKSQVLESRAQIGVAQKVLEGMATKTRQAQADQSAAELDLSYTKIAAPCDGQVTRKNVEPGNYVQVGQSLLALVTTNLWVVANFKESQLTHMRPGQLARIRIDAYPDRRFRGHVDSVQAGSGSRFSLLPPENAVGNYVKIVQRVPVKLYFDEPLNPAMSLGPGMSVVPWVRISEFSTAPWVLGVLAVVLAALTVLGLLRVVRHLRS
jgi:membrane fusion protein (multidrug efflux system)